MQPSTDRSRRGNNPCSGLGYTAKDSTNNTCTGQVFTAGTPTYSPVIGMPSTNSQMKKETRSDLPVDVPRPGCLYTGPTKIVFNSAATMTIRSPWTKKTNVAGDPATSGTTPAACGIVGTGANGLGSAAGATIPVLDAEPALRSERADRGERSRTTGQRAAPGRFRRATRRARAPRATESATPSPTSGSGP